MTSGFVYFVRCGDFAKIGFSKSPHVRLHTLRTATPFDFKVAAVHAGTRADEAALHRVLRTHHHRREWFRWCEDIAEIVQHGLPHFDTRQDGPGAAFRELINGYGLAAFAADIGVSENTAKQMRTRKSVPSEYWDAWVVGAQKRGRHDITLQLLASFRRERRRAAAPSPERAAS